MSLKTNSSLQAPAPVTLNFPEWSPEVVQYVEAVVNRAGIRPEQVPLLKSYLEDAAGFDADARVLRAEEARIGLAEFFQAVGLPREAVAVWDSYAQLADAPGALGFTAAPRSVDSELSVAAQRLLPGMHAAMAAVERLADSVAAGLKEVRAFRNNGYSTRMYTATAGEQLVVLRAVRRDTAIGHFEAERSNNLMFVLATQMGAPDVVLPSLVLPKPSRMQRWVDNETVMVFPHAGPGFKSAGMWTDIRNDNVAKIREDDRLTAAVLSFLTRHNDARPNNTLVNDQGDIRFIDHDQVLGRPVWYWADGPVADDYFKGGLLGYTSDQSSYAQLPERIRVLIDGLSSMSNGQIMAMYNCTEAEAGILGEQARRIQELGLDEAIRRFPIPVVPTST